MTIENLKIAIEKLILKRQQANENEQQAINEKLTKLYDLKYLYFEQQQKFN